MEERNYKLYVHISPSNKRYYGITCKDKCEDRWVNGKGYSGNKHFTNAINKYGWDNFKHIILFDNLTEEEASLLEQMYIALYDTFDDAYGYNQSLGGEHGLHSEKSKKKISEAKKGRQFTEEHKNKLSETHKGYKHTEETKKKLSESHKGKHLTEETKKKISESLNGKTVTQETKKKLSAARKGKNKGKDHASSKSVLMFTLDGQFIRRFDCVGDANEYLGKGRYNKNIRNCVLGLSKTAYGYHWEYITEEQAQEAI